MTELVTFSGRRASQRYYELTKFIDLLKERNVRSYLEIGARHGDTFHEIMKSLPKGSYGMAVDYPGARWGTGKSKMALDAVVYDLRNRGYKIDVVFGDSKSDAVRRIVMNHAPFDAIFIDGDHTLAGVTADWLNYGSLASLVAFHDIAGEGQSTKDGLHAVDVPQFWASLQPARGAAICKIEIIDPDSRGMGIGVVTHE